MKINHLSTSKLQYMHMVHKSKEGGELWLGDFLAAKKIQLLKQKNIRSVLTSAAMLKINYPKECNINHKIINALDDPSYKMTPHFDEAYWFISDGLAKGNVLVHCAAGISRSTTFVLVYLMKNQKMTYQKSLEYVKSKRPSVYPNYGFQKQLKNFQLNLKKQNQQHRKNHIDTQNESEEIKQYFFIKTKNENENENDNEQLEKSIPKKVNEIQQNRKNLIDIIKGKSLNSDHLVFLHQQKTFSTSNNKILPQVLTFKLERSKTDP